MADYRSDLTEGGVEIDDRAELEWYRFAELPTVLLYEVLRFRQAIFVVEQRSPYPDLDGQDERAHHLLLRIDGALAGYARLIPFPDEARIAIGRVAVAASQRRQGLAGLLMDAALAAADATTPIASSRSAHRVISRRFTRPSASRRPRPSTTITAYRTST